MAKVLMSAFACRPGAGSEPGIGWNFATHAATDHDVWVLTRPDNRESIEKYVNTDTSGAFARLKFVYVPFGKIAGKLPGKLTHVKYAMWQKNAARAAQQLHAEIGFDIAHHVTYGCYWQSSGLHKLEGISFVWGPVGGGESTPRGLLSALPTVGVLKERTRDITRWAGECSGGVKRTADRATIGLATTQETADRMKALGVKRVEVFTAMGLTAKDLDGLSSMPTASNAGLNGALNVVSVGRLLDWKGFNLGLQAFAKANLPAGSKYIIIGDGPAMGHLRQVAAELNLGDNVHFAGHLPREKAMELLATAHALAHPSLHDSGGWVVLEAMAMGKPVVCLELHGPQLMVSEETGIRVPATTPGQVVTDLAAAFSKLAADSDLVERMGNAGRQRVKDVFSWESRRSELNRLYDELTGKDAPTIGRETTKPPRVAV